MKFFRIPLLVISGSIIFVVSCKKKDTPAPASTFSVDSTILTLVSTLNSKDSFTITANVSWTISVSPASSWLTITPLTGNGNQKIMVVASQANNSANAQTATITITPAAGSSLTAKTINLTQSAATPLISSFAPLHGKGGETVTITGVGFSSTQASNVVKFNGKVATVTSSTATSLSVTVPSLGGTGPINLMVGNKSINSTTSFVYDSIWTVSTVAGDGTNTNFDFPNSIAIDNHNGNIYVANIQKNNILKITTDGTVSIFAGNGVPGFVNGPSANAEFNAPNGVAVDNNGNVYVADDLNNRIRKIDAITGLVNTVAGDGTASWKDGAASSAQFNNPTGVALDINNNIYVADYGNNRIRKIDAASGIVSTIGGDGTAAWKDGNFSTSEFFSPANISVDQNGVVFVADAGNNLIRMIANGNVTTLAGDGTANYKDGPSGIAQFNGPIGIAIDNNGKLYIGDYSNRRIRVIFNGIVKTLAGNGLGGSVDGDSSTAQFNSPAGIAIDINGNIYVADQGNKKVRKITVN